MNLYQLQAKLNEGINWNAFSYILYKAIVTLLTFVLFKQLSTQDFSNWATTNSVIFLLLLWIDFGFRKSVPRFCPEFSKNKKALKQFMYSLLFFQGCLLIITAPLALWCLKKLSPTIAPEPWFAWCIVSLFLVEGIMALLRLVYHAHFRHKEFNIRATGFLMLETTANIFLIWTTSSSSELLKGLFITKICSGVAMNIMSLVGLQSVYGAINTDQDQDIDVAAISRTFLKHSCIMWMNNNLKSLSERNFLVPLLTYTIGPAQANLFKIANDGALFFHRIVIKTIGTTDTTFLSHVETLPDGKTTLPIAFKNLTTKVAGLCIPVIGFLIIFFVLSINILKDFFVLQTFFIITIGYLLETIMSPYERVLEVKGSYSKLAIAYLPYTFVVLTLLNAHMLTFIGLLSFIIILHGVRLVSSTLMMRFAQNEYALIFPLKYLLTLLLRWLLFFCFLLFLYMLLVYIGMFFFSSYSHTPFSPLYTYTSNTYSYKHLISQLFSGNGK